MTTSLLGSYDDNVMPTETGVSADPLAIQRTGVNGAGSTQIRYWRGHLTQSFEATARTVLNSFSNLGLRPQVGGNAVVRATGQLTDRTQWTASAEASYLPSFQFTPAVRVQGRETVPPPDPTSGVSELESFARDATGTLDHQWAAGHRTTLAYGVNRREFVTEAGLPGPVSLDTRTQQGTLGHTWDVRRNASVVATYGYNRQTAEELLGGERPLESNSASLGLQVQKPLSRTRSVTFSAGATALHIRTVTGPDLAPLEYVTPAGYGSAQLDFGQTWAATAEVNRAASVLQGITPQSFLTTSASLWAGGTVTRRWVVALSGTYIDGSPHAGQIGSFESLSGTAQLTYDLAQCCAATASYAYYAHRLRDVAAVPVGFPARFERNTARLGITVWLPFYGSFPATSRPAVGR